MPSYYEIIGRIYSISPIEEIPTRQGDTLRRATLILEQQLYDRYTGQPFAANYPSLEFTGKALDQLAAHKTGELVSVAFDVSGALYDDKQTGAKRSFTRLRAFRITPYVTGAKPEPATRQAAPVAQTTAAPTDELPF